MSNRVIIDRCPKTEPAFPAGIRCGRTVADAAAPEKAEPAHPARNAQNAYNSGGALKPLKKKAFHCRIIGHPGWPEIVRNGPEFPSQDSRSRSRGFNGKNGINSKTSPKSLKYNDVVDRINASAGMVLIGINGCNYLAPADRSAGPNASSPPPRYRAGRGSGGPSRVRSRRGTRRRP